MGFEPTSAHTYESEIQRPTTYATPTSPQLSLPDDYEQEMGWSFLTFITTSPSVIIWLNEDYGQIVTQCSQVVIKYP